jgi:hypothetical protein
MNGQQLCNGELDEQPKEMMQQKEETEENDEESPLNPMETRDLLRVLPAMDNLMMTLVTWTTLGSEVQKCKGLYWYPLVLTLRFPKKRKK